jgi:prepilin-type N-terminal cleavage/methylation domain-containing protein
MKILQKGMSLVETLVAIAILGILMGALLTMMNQEDATIRDSAEVLSAQLKANEMMETLKTLPGKDLKSSSSLVISELNHKTLEVRVSDFDDSGIIKKVVVAVIWFDRQGRERHYTLTTLRSMH